MIYNLALKSEFLKTAKSCEFYLLKLSRLRSKSQNESFQFPHIAWKRWPSSPTNNLYPEVSKEDLAEGGGGEKDELYKTVWLSTYSFEAHLHSHPNPTTLAKLELGIVLCGGTAPTTSGSQVERWNVHMVIELAALCVKCLTGAYGTGEQ